MNEPLPLSGGQAEVFSGERASAIPRRKAENGSRARGEGIPRGGGENASKSTGRPAPKPHRRDTQLTRSPPLSELQTMFLTTISGPATPSLPFHGASRCTKRWIADPIGIGVSRGLAVYRHAYRARLIGALADDFPTVEYAVGAAEFSRIAARVIARHPSHTRNLNTWGRAMLRVLEDATYRIRRRTFLFELARLEWALVEAVHAPVPNAIDGAALIAIPQERWGSLKFSPSASLAVIASPWPVNAFLQRFRMGENPEMPRPCRPHAATAVYREGFRVWRMDLSPVAHALLCSLVAGVPLGEALAQVDQTADPANVMRWFQSWVRGGVFSAIRL